MIPCIYMDDIRVDTFTMRHVCGICGDSYHKDCSIEVRKTCDQYVPDERFID